MFKAMKELHQDESGSPFVEYGLLIIAVVFAVASSMTDLGSTTGSKISDLEAEISSVGTP